jgi:DNA-binding transcriptional regulator YiaG
MQTIIVWGLIILLMPLHLLLRITEPRHVTIKRMKRRMTWQQLADRFGTSTSTVQRWARPKPICNSASA